jgi:hypothetical protein
MTTAMIAIAAAVVLVINAAVSIAIWRSSGLYEPEQKRLQYLLIWLVPLLGAAVSWVVLRAHSRPIAGDGDGITGNPYVPWNYPDADEGHTQHHDGGDGGH